MTLETYLAERLKNESMEDILASISETAAKVESKASVKDYFGKTLSVDNDILIHIHDNTITEEDIMDIILYFLAARFPWLEEMTSPTELAEARSKVVEEIKVALSAVDAIAEMVEKDEPNLSDMEVIRKLMKKMNF